MSVRSHAEFVMFVYKKHKPVPYSKLNFLALTRQGVCILCSVSPTCDHNRYEYQLSYLHILCVGQLSNSKQKILTLFTTAYILSGC